MMKPIALFALALAAVALVACGGGGSSTTENTGAAGAAQEAEETAGNIAEEAEEKVEEAEKEAKGGSAGSGSAVDIEANPQGNLEFVQKSATAKAGKVSLNFTNSSPVPHDVKIENSSGEEVGGTDFVTYLD